MCVWVCVCGGGGGCQAWVHGDACACSLHAVSKWTETCAAVTGRWRLELAPVTRGRKPHLRLPRGVWVVLPLLAKLSFAFPEGRAARVSDSVCSLGRGDYTGQILASPTVLL